MTIIQRRAGSWPLARLASNRVDFLGWTMRLLVNLANLPGWLAGLLTMRG